VVLLTECLQLEGPTGLAVFGGVKVSRTWPIVTRCSADSTVFSYFS
jgi:hypothetical protein